MTDKTTDTSKTKQCCKKLRVCNMNNKSSRNLLMLRYGGRW